ncbi:MAG: glycosyltransferase [Planctomycetota bacterium]|jgi:glycosyltransferase involved in cell wall biosynthesis
MPISGVRVLVIGRAFELPETYLIRHLPGTADILGTIAQFQPDVILTSDFLPGTLNTAAFEIRKRWLHIDPTSTPEAVIKAVEGCYAFNLWNTPPNETIQPLVSVYTGTFNTGDYLRETYQSLREQTYTNWEWVIVDDCSEDDTWARLEQLAREDNRVRPVRLAQRCGKIGGIKDRATRLARGAYLVELDHDDMLTDFALAEIVAAFQADPDVGMVYSDCSNFFENGTFHRFAAEGDESYWADRYHEVEYRGRKWLACRQPDIYDRFGSEFWQQFGWFLTVGPNHVRAYRASTLRALGGYNPNLPVADDWDLYVRFFLHSKCKLVSKLLYLYRFRDNWANATFTRNQSIQDHLELGRAHYADEAKRFNEWRTRGKVETDGPLLTVAVCAITERADTSLPEVIAELRRQAEGQPVEILCLLDNRARSLAEKRNTIIGAAKGQFVAFVDDDDRVEPDYCAALLEAIQGQPNADVVVFDVEVHGAKATSYRCRYGVEYQDEERDGMAFRRPNHVMCWRTDLARSIPYRDVPLEDSVWSREAVSRITYQARVDRVLYHYDFDPMQTTQRDEPLRVPTYDISFVVLEAADTPDLTERCLKSIRKHAPGAEIIFVANGVPFRQELREQGLVDWHFESEINLGFAAGCNVGADAATRPYLCFLNNDAAFVDDTPTKLIDAITNTHPIVAPYSNRAKPPQGDVQTPPAEDAFPEAVVGLCLMLPAGIYGDLGGFDPRFLTWEDDDFCARARALDYRCKVVGGAWVYHKRHATFEALGLDVQEVMGRNRAQFERRHPRIRVVAIAKDEATCIEGFFEQFQPVTTDWCLLDTGSTDDTVGLAKKLGVRVEHVAFEDFAQARNTALDLFSEGADWIIMLDPDERLDPGTIQHLRESLVNGAADIYLAPLQAVYPNGDRRDFVPKPFVFRARPDIRWIFKVHEKLVGGATALVANACIEHELAFHEADRRQASESLYSKLGAEEPYHSDPTYREKMRDMWPILDYDRLEDDRIARTHFGPLITVVVPTHDRPTLLLRAVESALAQDYSNLDIVVVHDGGDTKAAERHVGDLDDPRIREFTLPQNHGAGGAVPRNYALKLAAGSLIAYLDDDNYWEPNHLSTLYNTLRAHNAAFAFSSMHVIGQPEPMLFTEPKRLGIDTSCILHRRDLIVRYGDWKNRDEATYAHDWELVERWLKGGESWVPTGIPTLRYNAETSGQADFLAMRT